MTSRAAVAVAAREHSGEQVCSAASATASKTVLMISYAFPPEAYVGGRRTLKYCKYLGEFGWHPIVVTIKPRRDAVLDERLCDQLPPDVVVQRTRDLDLTWCVERLSSLWHRLHPSRSRAMPPPTTTGESAPPAAPGASSMCARFKDAVIDALIASPDSHWPWVFFAFCRGARLLLTRRVDVIYSSSPPHSSHVAAFLLAKCFRKPFVVDFRDPWLVETRARGTGRPSGLAALQALVRRRIVANAARVVVVTPGEPVDLMAEFPDLRARQVSVITNGYDPDDLSLENAPAPDPAQFTITHLGTLYAETGRDLFHAVEQLIADRPDIRRTLRLNFAGDIHPSHREALTRLETLGVARVYGFLSQHDAIRLARESDALVLLQRGKTSPSHIPAKVFEYLSVEKPILAVVEPGTLTEILGLSGLGVVVAPGDPAAIADALLTLHNDVRSGRLQLRANRQYISRFDRRTLTASFAALLDDAASGC
jgi:glycosyltransferase involved in cell wall biosynthesis